MSKDPTVKKIEVKQAEATSYNLSTLIDGKLF